MDQILVSYKDMECNMSLKIYFLDLHLDFLPDILRAASSEHGERFPPRHFSHGKDVPYQEPETAQMLTDYCWTLIRDIPGAKRRRKSTNLAY